MNFRSDNSRRYEVLITDDHAVVRRGLRQLLESEPDLCVCGEAASEHEAFDLVERLKPDLLVTDLMLAGANGLGLIKRVHRYYPKLPVLVVSVHAPELYARRALAAGALGYVCKSDPEGDVVRAAREVLRGRTYVKDPIYTEEMVDEADLLSSLSDRELEVFQWIGHGYHPRHIAEKLPISPSTVEVHRERLKQKLKLSSSAELLRYAIECYKAADAE